MPTLSGAASQQERDSASIQTIVMADDDELLRRLVRTTLQGSLDLQLIEAGDGRSALDLVRAHHPDLILLDVNMPELSGLECCRAIRADPDPDLRQTPIILLTGLNDVTDREAGREAGANDYMTKPFSPRALIAKIEHVLAAAPFPPGAGVPADDPAYSELEPQILVYANDLSTSLRELREAHARLQVAYLQTVEALAAALETRDAETAGHCSRVTLVTLDLAVALGYPPEDMTVLRIGASLHDVGKIGVPDAILRKPGKLTQEEWTAMRRHPEFGEQMLQSVEFIRQALPIVASHHERWDGLGYPRGLRGDEIPLAARIFMVADTIDAMISDRPYRRALPWDAAYDEVVRGKGSQFDPVVVEIFQQRADHLRTLSTVADAAG